MCLTRIWFGIRVCQNQVNQGTDNTQHYLELKYWGDYFKKTVIRGMLEWSCLLKLCYRNNRSFAYVLHPMVRKRICALHLCVSLKIKLRRILRPGIAICLKFTALSIICVWTYKNYPELLNIRLTWIPMSRNIKCYHRDKTIIMGYI